MKALLLVICMASSASAGPYFRLLDPKHPHTSAGAYVAVDDPKQSSVGTALALITHSPRDGSILPSLPDDWTPLAVGFSANAGKYLFGIGPSANIIPVVRQCLYNGVLAVVPDPEKYAGLKSLLGPNSSPSDVAMAFGPAWVISPTEGWKGYFRLQAGLGWAF